MAWDRQRLSPGIDCMTQPNMAAPMPQDAAARGRGRLSVSRRGSPESSGGDDTTDEDPGGIGDDLPVGPHVPPASIGRQGTASISSPFGDTLQFQSLDVGQGSIDVAGRAPRSRVGHQGIVLLVHEVAGEGLPAAVPFTPH
jgi:hypothetical protein